MFVHQRLEIIFSNKITQERLKEFSISNRDAHSRERGRGRERDRGWEIALSLINKWFWCRRIKQKPAATAETPAKTREPFKVALWTTKKMPHFWFCFVLFLLLSCFIFEYMLLLFFRWNKEPEFHWYAHKCFCDSKTKQQRERIISEVICSSKILCTFARVCAYFHPIWSLRCRWLYSKFPSQTINFAFAMYIFRLFVVVANCCCYSKWNWK